MKINLRQINQDRKMLIHKNAKNDHVYLLGKSSILLSAPHGVSQVRLGKYKYKEIGSLNTALLLKKLADCHLIAKTRNNNDDANFDLNCSYRETIKKLVKQYNIKYLIDFHGLAAYRPIDINLGINLGKNIENNIKIFDVLCNELKKNNFTVSIDQPFMAGKTTISGSMKAEFDNLWTIQIEINCAITNRPENKEKYALLIDVLLDWLKYIEKN